MKKLILLILFILALFLLQSSLLAQENKWQIYKSTHFIVYYKSAKEDFIRQVADKAEQYYDKIADDLGFRRYNFWLWDERAKIYIYDDAQSYRSQTGQPAWSSGSALPKDKIINTYCDAPGFLDVILPHEMGHIIFREFVGFDNPSIPLWMDEGVASFQENYKRAIADSTVKKAIKEEKFIKLEGLSGINPDSLKEDKSVSLFYAEALSVINYLIKEFGRDKFVSFCQYVRDHKDLERAFSYSYYFKNIQELDEKWQAYLNK